MPPRPGRIPRPSSISAYEGLTYVLPVATRVEAGHRSSGGTRMPGVRAVRICWGFYGVGWDEDGDGGERGGGWRVLYEG